jgi:hypothetical protein
MNVLALVVIIVLVSFASACHQTIAPEEIIGTWKLVSMTYQDQATGKEVDLWGDKPIGFLTYTAEGRMSAVIAAADRPLSAASADQAPPEEQARLFRSCFAYAGSYTMTGAGVIHHVQVANDPTWVGKDQVRYLKIEKKKLFVSAPPIRTVGDPNPRVLLLVWEKLEK